MLRTGYFLLTLGASTLHLRGERIGWDPMTGLLYFDPYFWVTIPGILLAAWAQMKLSAAYGRYSRVGTVRGVTGADVARLMLDRNGMANVEVYRISGELTDHYDPGRRAVFLSHGVHDTPSVAAAGIAAHEVGHAIQHKTGYAWLGFRMAMVGLTGFSSKASWFLILGGMVFSNANPRSSLGRSLLFFGIMLFGVTVAFQMVTLPVEFDASSRAKRELLRLGIIVPEESTGISKVLSAAALTYVAGLLTSVLELVRLLLIFRRPRDEEDR